MSDALVIFARSPDPGRVKTRLVPSLTPGQAAALYEASLRDVVQSARALGVPLRLLYDESKRAAGYFRREFPDLSGAPQKPGDLGERLSRGFEACFEEGFARVAIIGADAPTLPKSMLSRGLLAARDADVALGPALDGGYYLVAIRSEAWPRAERIFQEIPWSTERVLERTLERAREAGLEAAILETWYDIDEYEDLIRAARDVVADGALARLLSRGGFLPPG